MSERLSDECVAEFTNEPLFAGWAGRDLAREVLAWRALVNGGPVWMSRSAGDWWLCDRCQYSMLHAGPAPRCPECSTRPGLIARLEDSTHWTDDPELRTAFDVMVEVAAELRGMTP